MRKPTLIRALAVLALVFSAAAGNAGAQAPGPSPQIKRLLDTFNDDKIAFNEKPLVVGSESAKVTAILFYAPTSEDAELFMRRIFPTLKQDFIDKGKLRLIVMDYPLNWKDMQALAGLRCLPESKHLEGMLRSAQDNWTRWLFRIDDLTAVPGQFARHISRFDVPAEQSMKCMRNLGVLGFIEGSRRLAAEQWGIQESPALAVGSEVLVRMNSANARDTIEFLRKQGME